MLLQPVLHGQVQGEHGHEGKGGEGFFQYFDFFTIFFCFSPIMPTYFLSNVVQHHQGPAQLLLELYIKVKNETSQIICVNVQKKYAKYIFLFKNIFKNP